MQVCHFVESLPGGTATYLNELMGEQVKLYGEGNVWLVCPAGQVDYIHLSSVRVIGVDYKGRTLGNALSLLLRYRKIIKEHAFDILHFHSTISGFVGRIAAIGSGRPEVYCSHGWAFKMEGSAAVQRVYAVIERVLSLKTDAVIAISQDEQDAGIAAGINAKKCHLIHNGIQDQPALPASEHDDGRLRVLFVGRLDRQKGVDLLLEAFRSLEPDRFELRVVGGQILGKNFEYPTDLPSVEFRGWKNPAELRDELAWADLVVVPSRWEGFGLVAVEAMRAQRAVAASNVGGLRDIVVPNETGILFDATSPSEIAAALRLAAGMDLKDMGKNGRQRFEAFFSSERMAAEVDEVYRQCLRAHRQ